MRIRKLTERNACADVTVKVPDSEPVATLYATPIAGSSAVAVASSFISVKDAPQPENSAFAVPPWYWTQTAISRSPACGPAPPLRDERLGKVCVVTAVVVAAPSRSPLAVVGIVGKDTD
jgi:hypothetical protein